MFNACSLRKTLTSMAWIAIVLGGSLWTTDAYAAYSCGANDPDCMPLFNPLCTAKWCNTVWPSGYAFPITCNCVDISVPPVPPDCQCFG